MTTDPGRRTFLNVQALRGLAALMVVIHHATQTWSGKFLGVTKTDGWANGAAGVDVFFVISGFVMAVSSLSRKKHSPLVFLVRRATRIFPMYWIATGLALTKSFMLHTLSSVSIKAILFSLLLLPHRQTEGVTIFPILAVGWTLSYEMFFYFVLALCLTMPSRFVFPALLALMVSFVVVGHFRVDSWPAVSILFEPIILEFVAGTIIGYAVLHHVSLPTALKVLLGTAGLIGILLLPERYGWWNVLYWGLPSFLLVGSAAMLESNVSRFLPRLVLRIGDSSYSLYLLHTLLLSLFAAAYQRAHVVHNQFVFVALSLVTCCSVALLSYRFIEAPLTEVVGKYLGIGTPRIIVQGKHIETGT